MSQEKSCRHCNSQKSHKETRWVKQKQLPCYSQLITPRPEHYVEEIGEYCDHCLCRVENYDLMRENTAKNTWDQRIPERVIQKMINDHVSMQGEIILSKEECASIEDVIQRAYDKIPNLEKTKGRYCRRVDLTRYISLLNVVKELTKKAYTPVGGTLIRVTSSDNHMGMGRYGCNIAETWCLSSIVLKNRKNGRITKHYIEENLFCETFFLACKDETGNVQTSIYEERLKQKLIEGETDGDLKEYRIRIEL